MCGHMKEQGRELPFNGLSIGLLRGGKRCHKDSGCDGDVHVNLPSELKLKYLYFTCFSATARHHIRDPSANLIRDHASELKHLTAHSVLLLKSLLSNSSGQPATFPKLEEINVSEMDPFDPTEQRNILRSLHAKSPNLRTIFVDDTNSLGIIPEEFYGLVGNLEFFDDEVFSEEFLFRQIVAKKPKVRELTIYECKEDRANAEVQLPMRNFLTQLLQSCRDSLLDFTLHADDLHVLRLMSNHALKNLSNFSLDTRHAETIDELWNLLASIDGDKMMPRLDDLEIKLELVTEQVVKTWPARNLGGPEPRSYSSVRKLTLDLMCVTVNLVELKSAFPRLTSLELSLYRAEHVPCGEFWELWPTLEELKFSGTESILRQNYDAEFCGISEQEAELLRGMDEEYLRSVQIVPIQPSLLTMQS